MIETGIDDLDLDQIDDSSNSEASKSKRIHFN